ncbi:MAG: hypothetical protein NVS2B3_08390 [Vulcanimicrobiaceae bacterium]
MDVPFEVWASPEPTIARIDADTYRDQCRETGHDRRDGDLDLLASLGISATRYPVLWEAVAPNSPHELDLRWAKRRLERLRELEIEPIVTLLHHGSGPRRTSLIDPAFPDLFAAYARDVADAFPWVRRWTPINEPLTTARFATLYGCWYPNLTSDAAFGAAVTNEALGMLLAMDAIRARIPHAELVATEDLQSFTALDRGVEALVAHKRRRMYLSLDLVMGRVRPGHELYAYLTTTCGVPAARLERIVAHARAPELVAWNYYPNSERALASGPGGTVVNEPLREHGPISPLPLLRASHDRLRLPFGLGEVHTNADVARRVAWFEARAGDLFALEREGRPVRMIGAWAAFGLVDWDSLLTRFEAYREDGIFTFAGPDGVPQETDLAACVRRYAMAARRSADGVAVA